MDAFETLRTALDALVANKLRSALTMLGIVIGVASVISLMSIGSGAQAAIAANIKGLGANLITITPGAVSQGGVSQGAGSATSLTLNDATTLADAPGVAAVSPETTVPFTLQVAAQTRTTQVLTILLGAVAGISLVVGGIGVMNIMVVSVTERTREIGIRKAVGAKRMDILLQFLVEALAVSLLGGLIGIAIGMGVSRIVAGSKLNGQTLQTLVSTNSILLAVGVSLGVGLVFGVYPAYRASTLNAIDALRYE
jgi:ABC-type antimicrobial peptide transport system permease subunit